MAVRDVVLPKLSCKGRTFASPYICSSPVTVTELNKKTNYGELPVPKHTKIKNKRESLTYAEVSLTHKLHLF